MSATVSSSTLEIGEEKAEIFEVLSNRRRRYVVRACQQIEPPIEIGDLAERIAAWEHETTPQAINSEQRRRVYTSLQQTHLPKLEQSGFIEYERGVVEPTDALTDLQLYLEVVDQNDIPWAAYYLGLSVIAAFVTAGAWAGIYPDVVPAYGWTVLVIVAFALSAVVHYLHTRRHRIDTAGAPPGVSVDE